MHREQWLFLFSALYQKLNSATARSVPKNANILIVKRDEIGDVSNALHVFTLLKNRFPEAGITLWCRNVVVPIVANFEEIIRIHTENTPPSGTFHLYIDLRGDFNSLKNAIKHPRSIYLGRGLVRWNNKNKGGHKHEIETNTEIILPILGDCGGILPDLLPAYRFNSDEKMRVDLWISEHVIGPFVVLHTGSRDPMRRWPLDRFKELSKLLHEKYKITVLIGGGPDEREQVERMLAEWPIRAMNICGSFSINEFAYLCSKANLFVGNDSGPLHLAWISGCSTVGIFGPGAWGIFHPRGAHTRTLRHRLPGNENFGAPVTDISVDEVLKACRELMD